MMQKVAEVEDVVNEKIKKELPVHAELASLDQVMTNQHTSRYRWMNVLLKRTRKKQRVLCTRYLPPAAKGNMSVTCRQLGASREFGVDTLLSIHRALTPHRRMVHSIAQAMFWFVSTS